jgi:hypothetical protein
VGRLLDRFKVPAAAMSAAETARRAEPADAAVGRLLHDFNTEYDDSTSSPTGAAKAWGGH